MELKRFGLYFANLRETSGYDSQRQLSQASGVSNGTIARIESGTQKVSPETLKKLAPYLKGVTYDDLLIAIGYTEKKELNNTVSENALPYLTEKDEIDMAKRMDKMKRDLIEGNADGQALNYMGEPMSEEAIESLLEALEIAERITTLANKKYAPNKYKDKE